VLPVHLEDREMLRLLKTLLTVDLFNGRYIF
jgi:hypothetical protein